MVATINKATGAKKSAEDSEYITLKVKSTNRSELCFKIRRSTKLKKLMDTYHMLESNFPFLFDGRRLQEDQTPDEAGLVDGDEIDVIKPIYGLGTNIITLDAERIIHINHFEAGEGKISSDEKEDKNSADACREIIVKVLSKHGREVHFRIRRSTKLIRLMRAYCDRFSLDINNHRFLLYGRSLGRDQTPDEAGLEDGDEIDVFAEQRGGG